jgi:pantoate--beta-alanine ligase
VNPTQFGPSEDFNKYPRDLDADLRRLAGLGVDAVFAPAPAEMYPSGFQTTVELTKLPKHLCGLRRTNHFAGVAQVVLKLFNICQPDCAVFGQKDFQQVRVIEQMVADLNLGIEIIRHPIVREPDGLAMSSRNVYLSPANRADATIINRTLAAAEAEIHGGTRDPSAVVAGAVAAISAKGGDVEYFNVCDPVTLDDLDRIEDGCRQVLLVTAVRFGTTRLIDNRLVDVCG